MTDVRATGRRQGDGGVTEPPTQPEPDLDEAFDRLLEEGANRLSRPWLTLCVTGLVGGIDVGTGRTRLPRCSARDRLQSARRAGVQCRLRRLLLARSELFTENFLVPVTSVVAKRSSWGSLARLWGVTLALNLLGGWGFAWLITRGYPELRTTAREAGTHYADLGVNLRSSALAVLPGVVITLMTRMQHATESFGVQLVPAVLFGALLAGGQLFHSVLDSLLMFTALHTGTAAFGYVDWLGALAWSAFGNVVGGVGLVTFLRLFCASRPASPRSESATPEPRWDRAFRVGGDYAVAVHRRALRRRPAGVAHEPGSAITVPRENPLPAQRAGRSSRAAEVAGCTRGNVGQRTRGTRAGRGVPTGRQRGAALSTS